MKAIFVLEVYVAVWVVVRFFPAAFQFSVGRWAQALSPWPYPADCRLYFWPSFLREGSTEGVRGLCLLAGRIGDIFVRDCTTILYTELIRLALAIFASSILPSLISCVSKASFTDSFVTS